MKISRDGMIRYPTMTKEELINTFLSTPPENWSNVIQSINGVSNTLLVDLNTDIVNQLFTMARLSQYLLSRGGAGMGDSGHSKSLHDALLTENYLRGCMGYEPVKK